MFLVSFLIYKELLLNSYKSPGNGFVLFLFLQMKTVQVRVVK